MEPIDVRGYSQPLAGTTTGLISLVAVRSAVFKRLRLERVAAPRNDDVDVSFHSREDLQRAAGVAGRQRPGGINSFKSEMNNLSRCSHTRMRTSVRAIRVDATRYA